MQIRIFKYGIRRMSDCIVELRLRILALILLFLISFFPILYVDIKTCVRVVSGSLEARTLEHGMHLNNELF